MSEITDSILILPGHAIYQNKRWYGGWPNEESYYEKHILEALEIMGRENFKTLILTGGHTRPDLPEVINGKVKNSEADGLLQFISDRNLLEKKYNYLLEKYARDNFENIFFSLLCYYSNFNKWPTRIGLLSWKFKAVRFYIIASGLKLGNGMFFFYGSGDLVSQEKMEIYAASDVLFNMSVINIINGKPEIVDPFHRHENFCQKRNKRMLKHFNSNSEYLEEVKKHYDKDLIQNNKKQGIIGNLIDLIENIGIGSDWKNIKWPWIKS